MGSKGAQGSPGEQGPRSQHLQIDLGSIIFMSYIL